jgi:hypothetical protein
MKIGNLILLLSQEIKDLKTEAIKREERIKELEYELNRAKTKHLR